MVFYNARLYRFLGSQILYFFFLKKKFDEKYNTIQAFWSSQPGPKRLDAAETGCIAVM